MKSNFTRRQALALAAAGAQVLSSSSRLEAASVNPDATRAQRMQWWHEARFGMFIHWGLYSVNGRHEWVMENEAIPVVEYEPLAKKLHPKPNAARDWARLAKAAG